MTDLLRAELLRLVSRRVAWVVLTLAVVVGAFGAVSTASYVRPLDTQDHVLAQQYYEDYERQRAEDCRNFPEECRTWEPMSPSDFLRQPQDYESYIRSISDVGMLLVAIAAVLAAAMVGGEFRSGAISTQLTFTPRRLPVMFAKMGAAVTGAVGLMVAFLGTVLVLGTISFLMLRGASDLTATAELPLSMLRMLLTTLLVAALAAALTFVVGSTLMAVGLGLLAVIGSEFAVTSFSFTVPGWLWILPTPNLFALLNSEYQQTRWDPVLQESVPVIIAGFPQALAYGVVLVVLVTIAGAVMFKRRDLLR